MVTTPAPCFRNATILDSPFAVVDGSAIMGLPPSDRVATLNMFYGFVGCSNHIACKGKTSPFDITFVIT